MTEKNETTAVRKVSKIIDDDKNTKLHYSAATGNEEELLKDLENEQKIDAENYLGWTPLMMACKNGQLDVVQLLLTKRADATKTNKYGMSVFLVSISSGNLEIVHLILQHLLSGGVSRLSMQKLISPLSLAILFFHQDILKYLIEQNFDLNTPTPLSGITPLMFAAAMENCEAITLLNSKGADATIKNSVGFTADGITQFRNQKSEVRQETNVSQNSPSIMITAPHLQGPQTPITPCIAVISPQPSFYPFPANHFVTPHIRKSSNAVSPGFYFTTPNVTPIAPVNLNSHQIFFPPGFSPSQIYNGNSVPCYYTSNEFLNARINPNIYVSPIPQTVNYPSPCM